MRALMFLAMVGLGAAPLPAAPRAQVIFAGGSWAAIDRGEECETVARPLAPAVKRAVAGSAGFAFAADRRRWGELRVRLSRPVRPGSTVMLTIGRQPFLLLSRGSWAWGSPRQDQAILAAVRAGASMRIESRDASGRRFTDRYLLSGAPTAIDAAAARCAGKSG